MNNTLLSTIGTWLYALVVGFFGINHFRNADGMAGMVPKSFPGGGAVWVYVAGACLVLAALSILSGKFTKWACICLAVLLLIFVFTIHLPNATSEDGGRQAMGMAGLLKDSAMAGAALIIAGKSK